MINFNSMNTKRNSKNIRLLKEDFKYFLSESKNKGNFIGNKFLECKTDGENTSKFR